MTELQDQLDLELIKKKAVSGVVTFTIRTFIIQVFTFAATFILTILLEPSIFGVFFLVSALINFFIYFSDIGLAAALIQKKEDLTKDDLATTFTIQQTIILTLVVIGLLFSYEIANFYKLDSNGLMLLRVLIFSFFLSSLKTIPSIILERRLNFTRLVIPQVIENVVFYSVAVVLALSHFQIASFTWAVLARGIAGLIAVYLLCPWVPSISFNLQSAKKLTSFGLPFQLNSVLALIKDDLLTIFLGKILPLSQIGYIGWSQKWAYLPLRFFMDNVNKVTFPTYSRLQEHKEQLTKAIEKSIFFVTFLTYPSILGMLAIAPSVIHIVPNYQKWLPALPLLYLFSINALFSTVSTTFTNTLFALGKPKIVLNLMIFWTVSTWVLTIPLVMRYGFLGVGIASALIATTSLATIYFANKIVKVSVFKGIVGPLFVSLIMFVIVRSILIALPLNPYTLSLSIVLGVIIYVTISFFLFKKPLTSDLMLIIKSIFLKKV